MQLKWHLLVIITFLAMTVQVETQIQGPEYFCFRYFYCDIHPPFLRIINEIQFPLPYNQSWCENEINDRRGMLLRSLNITDDHIGKFCKVCRNDNGKYTNCTVCYRGENTVTRQLDPTHICRSTPPPSLPTLQPPNPTQQQRSPSNCIIDSNLLEWELHYCLNNLTANCTDNKFNCSVLPFFEPEFCMVRQNFRICGEFCWRRSPCVPEHCNKKKIRACTSFIINGSSPRNETEEIFVSSTLLNYVNNFEVEDVALGIRRVHSSVRARRSRLTPEISQNSLNTLDVVFGKDFSSRWSNITNVSVVMEMWSVVDDTLIFLTEDITSDTDNISNFVYRGNNMAFDVMKFRRRPHSSHFNYPTVDQMQNSALLEVVNISIPFSSPCDEASDADGCYVTVGVSIIDNFAEYITTSINESGSSECVIQLLANSALVSVVVQNSMDRFLDFSEELVNFHFMTKNKIDMSTNRNYTHVGHFLNSSFCWSNEGLNSTSLSDEIVQVTSNHLTSFAILASPTGNIPLSGKEAMALQAVSYIGIGISILTLGLTILTLVIFRKKLKKGVLLHIHLHLAISLFLAMIVFVAGVENAAKLSNKILCKFVAALIQYLFLCAFFWMLGEGVMLYLLIVRVFGNATKRWYLLLPICWGIPVPIVAVSAGLRHNDYITNNDTICWINASSHIIWTFIVPVIFIICVNTGILILTLCSIAKTRQSGGTDNKESKTEMVKTAVKGSLVLLPLLGLTWVFGLFAVSQNTSVFAWIFTIANSFQGLAIFLLHIVRNEYVLSVLSNVMHKFSCTRKTEPHSSYGTRSTELNGKSMDMDYSDPLSTDMNKSHSELKENHSQADHL